MSGESLFVTRCHLLTDLFQPLHSSRCYFPQISSHLYRSLLNTILDLSPSSHSPSINLLANMVDLSLPAKPTTALPSLKDAVDANYRRAVPMMPITFGALYSQFHPSSSPPPTSKKRKLGDESTAADNELAEKRSKPSPVDAPNKTSTYRPQAQPSNDKGSASAAQAPRYPEHPTNSGLGLNYTDNRRFGPTSCSIRYDPVTRSFHPTRPLAFQSFLAPPTSVAANGGSTTTMQSTINTQTNGTKHHEPVEHRYNLRKRKAPAEDKDQDISAPAPKRLNQKATSNNSKECDNQQQQQPIAKPTTPVKKEVQAPPTQPKEGQITSRKRPTLHRLNPTLPSHNYHRGRRCPRTKETSAIHGLSSRTPSQNLGQPLRR